MSKLLDLFCGAGGAGMGYYRAGWDVLGVDITPQPSYPFPFVQADALEYARAHGNKFDVIHASPPCQEYSITKSLKGKTYPDLILPTREVLCQLAKPYVIENVEGAPLINPIMLCGTMFGLRVLRHRLFETSFWFWPPYTCQHDGKATGNRLRRKGITRTPSFADGYKFITVAGNNYLSAEGAEAMGIDWMKSKKELSQAIPPAYTEYIGVRMKEVLSIEATA